MIVRGLAFFFTAGVVGMAHPLFAQSGLQARFDWSMPDRFGQDVRSLGGAPGPDGIRDYWITFMDTWSEIDQNDPQGGSPNINPPSWRVDLDASASTGNIVSYRWSVNGTQVAVRPTPLLAHDFPTEGKYSVTLTVADAQGKTDVTTREIIVQDWLIVAIGDSYASGEGNPEPGGMAWLEKIVSAYSDFEKATADLNNAIQTLKDTQLNFQVTSADVQPALDALNTWHSECPAISLACVKATGELTAELVKLGFSEAAALITKGFDYVKAQIQNILDVAQAAVKVAQEGADAAQAAVNGAQAEIDLIFQQGATWQTRPDIPNDRASHRSSLSGQALAALALERADPHTSVTFVHLAYSGARILGSDSYLVSDDGKSQLDYVKQLVGGREIDALLVSIGGNDVGFADIMASLALSDDQICGRLRTLVETQCRQVLESIGLPAQLSDLACAKVVDRFGSLCLDALSHVSIVPKVEHEDLLREGLAKLPERFTALADHLRSPQMFPDLPPSRIYFTEYPNLTEGDDGSICPDFLTVTSADWLWVRDTMTTGLNAAIRQEVTKRGWNFVDGIFGGFHGHGYCANDHWVNHPEESLLIQGDFKGTAHPTAAGHQVYGDRIASRLFTDLYSSGDLSRPRAPGYDQLFRRGDSNRDGTMDLSDALSVLEFLFLGGGPIPCEKAADANDDGVLDISDALRILGFLFLGGAAPPAPYGFCGGDPTPDLLTCSTDPACR